MKKVFHLVFFLSFLLLLSCRKHNEWTEEFYDERLSGGSQTVFVEGTGAFGFMYPNIPAHRKLAHEIGDAHFEASFIAAPAPKFEGLGTIYNNNACINCHINDGRGKPIAGNEPLSSLLFRISVPGADANGGPLGIPGFGTQLQDKAVFGYQPEAKVSVDWNEQLFYFPDGTTASLRSPNWSLYNEYIPLPADYLLSARIAPPVFGLGLLEQISEQTLLSFVDENDLDGDGISGRANYVWDDFMGKFMIGRFGWKADAPTIQHQVAGAYNEDMGITSYVMPVESHRYQSQYDNLQNENEVADSIFDAVVYYVQSLAVPARRNVQNEDVMAGKKIFNDALCAKCHIPTIRTQTSVLYPESSNQIIHPYTDLLLHDMGPALSDNRPVFRAQGVEWRTPPLWGIGLTQAVNGHNFFLHDGRARNITEAILWHGGEAEYSKNYFINLSSTDRNKLLRFIQSL